MVTMWAGLFHSTRDYLPYIPAQHCLLWLGTVSVGHLVGHELRILLCGIQKSNGIAVFLSAPLE